MFRCLLVNGLILKFVGTEGLSSFSASNSFLGFACYAQAAQKKLMSVVLPVVDGFVGVSLTSLFLIPAMKMNGLYVANILNGVICIVVILIFSCLGTRRFPKNLDDLMVIPADFGPSADDRIDITVRSMKDVETVSKQVIDFCRRRGTDERRAFLSGLALEEMAGNVVKHGFTLGRQRPHSLDIRVIRRGDDIILRLRDDCLPFDPAMGVQIQEPQSPEHNIGTRIVFRISRKVEYQNLLGCNVLTITI